jgi:hypothetical protein
MKGLYRYYLVRAVISAALAALVALAGAPWWGALLAGLVFFGLFVWAVRSGRYVVEPERGAAALRSDEYTRAIRDRATRYGFVAVMLALGAIVLYYGLIADADVPVAVVGGVLLIGWIVYFLSDLLARRE